MTETALRDALADIVGADRVLDSALDRHAYARDCWPRTTIDARARVATRTAPRLIVQPGSEDEVVRVVRLAAERGIPVVPYGAGSGVCAAAVPVVEASVTIDVKRLRHLEIDADGLRARIGPGAIGEHFETALQRAGFTLGHYPSSLYCSSMGGYVAGRSAGQYSSRYGKIEDMVESVRWVAGHGEVYDTAELARDGGPDVLQLIVGSEGTLGVITDAVVRIRPRPEHRWYRGYLVPTVEHGTEAMRELMHAGIMPNVVRLYDEIDTLVGGKSGQATHDAVGEPSTHAGHEPRVAGGMFSRLLDRAREAVDDLGVDLDVITDRVTRTARSLMTRALGSPMLLHQAMGLVPGKCMLVVGLEGERDQLEAESAVVREICLRHGEDAGSGPGEHWYTNRFSVSYKMSPLMDTGAFTDTMEVSTTWSNLLNLYSRVRAAMTPHVLTMAHFSHAYHDGCSIYFTFAGFARDHEATLELYDRAWQAGLGAVAEAGASIAHHHGVGASKAAFTPFDHRGGAPLMDALKATFDPAGIFNPGKVWPTPEANP